MYYVATRLEADDLASGHLRDFDLGPIDRTTLGPLRAHILGNVKGNEYERAIERHKPRKPKFLPSCSSERTPATEEQTASGRGGQ